MSITPPSSASSRGVQEHARLDEEAMAEGTRRWRLPKGALAIAVLAMVGATIFFYPSTASWLLQYEQSKIVVELGTNTSEVAPDARQDALNAAHAYNDGLISAATLPAGSHKPASDGQDAGDPVYNSLLIGDASGAMGRLRIDSIAVDLPIYHGTDDVTLTKGVGHLQGTSLPVGGPSTHTVLTAHRGLAGATLFDRLDEMQIGDTFRLEVFGEVLTYRVIEAKVVAPEDTESLFPRYGEDLVTLVTCTPLGINSHRILVTAERVLPTPISDVQAAGTTPNIPGTPWWAVGMLGTIGVLSVYVWRMGRNRVEP